MNHEVDTRGSAKFRRTFSGDDVEQSSSRELMRCDREAKKAETWKYCGQASNDGMFLSALILGAKLC